MAADPQWLRTSLCEDLAAMDHARGRIPDVATIERIVDKDIEVWQAHERERKYVYAQAGEKRAEHGRHGIAKQKAKERDMRLDAKRHVKDEPRRVGCACGGSTCRACKLRLRIAALMAPVPLKDRVAVKYGEHYANCMYPAYAKEILSVWEWMKLAPRAQRLREKGELEAVVQRKLEDIADRSATAVIGMGPWR